MWPSASNKNNVIQTSIVLTLKIKIWIFETFEIVENLKMYCHGLGVFWVIYGCFECSKTLSVYMNIF